VVILSKSSFLSAQINLKIDAVPGTANTWGVYTKTCEDVFPTANTITGSGQVTVIFPVGLALSNLTSHAGAWSQNAMVAAPGEAPDKVGVSYISKAVSLARILFDSVGIEIQPLTETDYRTMITAGADSLTLYQETYHPEAYKTYHISGLKSRFQHRLDATDYGGRAGFYRLNIGALLGLYDWRWDALALAQHAHYLQRAYWQTKVMISMPRIRHTYGGFSSIYPVTDADLVQFICAFRMVFPDAGLSLSTREPAILRDHLIPLGITQMSAESNTSPGGYTIGDEEPQFEISDHRPLEEVTAMLQKKGYDVVMKDWNREFIAL
jgi:2-iminoacetate synthase